MSASRTSDSVQQLLPFLASLAELTRQRDIKQFLKAALHETIRLTNSEAGSLLLVSDRRLAAREGDLSSPIQRQIALWEDGLEQRLGTGSWRIEEREQPPISTHIMEDSRQLLANTPLLDDDKVTGSMTVVFASGHSLSLSQRQVLTYCAHSIGNLAKIIDSLTVTQDSLSQLSFLYDTSQALISTLDLREVLDNTMELATNILNAAASNLMLVEEDTKELVFAIPHGEKEALLRSYHMPLDQGIAGWVATHGEPAVVNDVSQDERFSRETDVRTGFLTESIICVPLQIKDRTIGVLEALNKMSGEGFTDDDLRLLSTLAAQAAIAIENARLYRSLHEERDKILRVQEQARRELARDLHDSTLQRLSSIAMGADYIKRLLKHEGGPVLDELDELQEMVAQASKEARTLLFELRPVALETRGLVPALEAYVQQLQGGEAPTFHLDDGGFDKRLSDELEGTTFIIVQEAISNARKHAEPKNIWISLAQEGEHLLIAVKDDGRGFDPETSRRSTDQGSHLGLLSMQERAELIGAELSVESGLDQGTEIALRVPLRISQEESEGES